MMKILMCGALALLSIAPAAAQTDRYGSYADSVQSSCRRWSTITPSDTVDLTELPKAIYVGGAGDITMIGVDAPAAATGIAWKGVPAASMLPVRPRRVLATGTTATLIVGCF